MKSAFSVLTALLLLSACAKKKADSSDSINELGASVESGMTAVQSAADEQSGESFADNRKTFETYAYQAKNLLLPEAWASVCSRAVIDPCVAGVKQETYSACQLPYSNRSMDGVVTLTYSDATCSMASTGDKVERTYEVNIRGLEGGILNISSASHTDYRGNTLGGGGRLTKTNAGWDIEVLGKHKRFTRNSRELFDISVRTTSPISVAGSLSRAGRTVNGGAFEVIHNKAQFTATYQPVNLAWSNVCCHPISGSLNVSYTGSVTGTATVTFNGCGLATLAKDGLSEDLTLNYCE